MSRAAPKNTHISLMNETEGFDGIEKAVINLKNQMRPDLQKQLLEEEQEEFIKKKPDSLRCNGTAKVTIKTLSGSFLKIKGLWRITAIKPLTHIWA